jgi:hypothetical protein
VLRKMPMLGRHERVLAIDGHYIHVRLSPLHPAALPLTRAQLMPSANKARTAMFESPRTVSYHVRAVAAVQQSAKASAAFKLLVQREAGAKRYEFEAESPRLAAEIVATIRALKAETERKGSVRGARRSRQVVPSPGGRAW